MPNGTARVPHVRLCGQFTAHTARAVKKIEKKFFYPFSSLFPPCPQKRSPEYKTNFFFDKKNNLTGPRKIEETREMSSPGTGKVTRPVQSWPKDYHTPVGTMDTDKILRSTLTEETRTQKGDTKTSSANHIQSTLNTLRRSVFSTEDKIKKYTEEIY
jgi:hypothetical protein